jgi:hypothetical protein
MRFLGISAFQGNITGWVQWRNFADQSNAVPRRMGTLPVSVIVAVRNEARNPPVVLNL